MRLWKPAPIADSRLGNEEQHEWRSGSTVFINYWVQSSSAPRCYNCNFCKRQFKSAQALGGHMNVHRRDRALLRLTSTSISPSTILPQDDNPILTCKPDIRFLREGLDCLSQQPHSALATSSENRSTTASPFLRDFEDDSRNLGCHCQTPYSEEAHMYRFRSDAVNRNSFELNIEQPICPHPLSVAGSGGIVEKRIRCLAVPGQDAVSTVGLDLELRLGNTCSSQSS